MPAPVQIEDLSNDGVTLVSPSAPEFDALATPLIGSRAARVLKMKPALVLLENQTDRTIVAVSLMWRVTKRVGSHVHRTNSKFPEVVVGDTVISHSRPGVRPGERHLVATGCVVEGLDEIRESDDWIEHFVRERDEMVHDALDILIALDAVIFDDGRLVGRDEGGWLRELFQTYVTEKQRWYALIRNALESGASVDDAFAPIRAFQAGARRGFPDGDQIWRGEAAADANSWRRRFPDDQIPAFLQSIRLEPFVVR